LTWSHGWLNADGREALITPTGRESPDHVKHGTGANHEAGGNGANSSRDRAFRQLVLASLTEDSRET
jgi:hypothetical protein